MGTSALEATHNFTPNCPACSEEIEDILVLSFTAGILFYIFGKMSRNDTGFNDKGFIIIFINPLKCGYIWA